jgi:ferric-dicitrate binding protein FerR (iron transport regulator)
MSDMPKGTGENEDALASVIRLAGRRPVAPDAVRARVYASVRAAWEQGTRTKRRPRPSPWWMAAAAALAAVTVAIGIARRPAEVPGMAVASLQDVRGELWIARGRAGSWEPVDAAADEAVRAGDALRTKSAGRAVVALRGDVSLRIAEETELVVQAADRVEVERGTIYVDSGVEPRPGAAIHVLTPVGEVKDVGTQFEVRADAASLRIRVREGAVQFEGGDRTLQGGAGEELMIPARGEAVRAQISPTDAAWTWAMELAALRRTGDYPAATLLQWVSRETGRALRFDNSDTEAHARALVVHGARGLSPLETLEVVAATTDLTCELDGATIAIHGSKAYTP